MEEQLLSSLRIREVIETTVQWPSYGVFRSNYMGQADSFKKVFFSRSDRGSKRCEIFRELSILREAHLNRYRQKMQKKKTEELYPPVNF
ncbi:hypothetical protein TNIN_254211 [Trichonephila inaurata madagascariensis]|uniref:Uncharacterized protein n=1 Tax=Trichonephila inaurata madagascariensis TaxID=2747483 RepID=A0A8X7C6I1_9ARAC|nr:hypothetical protein TNIN_254211 [Trichonephila inaurata madagascariensis]